MGNFETVQKRIIEFLERSLHVENPKITKVTEVGSGWEAEAEGYEASSLVKSLGLPVHVKDRNIYEIKMDGNMEIHAYESKRAELAGVK
ncbi:MAG: hypothetical protein ABIH89_06355 [Elusimicrobiota bacterium]